MKATKTITRKALYDQVWSEAMSNLAKRYGLSDVGLAKICKKHEIPRPSLGYWAKRQSGKEPPQTPLPNPDKDWEITIRTPSNREGPTVPRSAADQSQASENKQIRIEVAETLRGAHELVSQANQQLQSAETDQYGLIVRPKDAVLGITVSKPSLRRSLRIMDALLKGLERLGYHVTSGPTVEIRDVCVTFRLTESLRTEKEEPQDHDLEGEYRFGHSRFNQKRVPSGLLTIEIEGAGYWFRGHRHVWRDTPKRRLEDLLGKVAAGLVDFAAHRKEQLLEEERRRREEQERERQRQEQARLLAEKRQRFKAERARVDALLQQANNWKQSQELRDYIEAQRQKHVTNLGTVEPESDFARWLEWANQQADRLDPFVPSPPSILDENLGEEEQRPGSGRPWWNR